MNPGSPGLTPAATAADAVVALPASVTMQQASAVLRQVESALPAAGGRLAIDAGALQAFDTSLIAVLLQTLRSAQVRGTAVQVVRAPAKLVDLASLYGVLPLLPLRTAEGSAASTPSAA